MTQPEDIMSYIEIVDFMKIETYEGNWKYWKVFCCLKSSGLQSNELLAKHLSSLGFIQSKCKANIWY